MKFKYILATSLLALAACDPALHYNRVKPDQKLEKTIENTPLEVDVYQTKDKSVELQVFGSGGVLFAPHIQAYVVNNGKEPIRLDLMNTYLKLKNEDKALKPEKTWFANCEEEKNKIRGGCKSSVVEIAPGSTAEVDWGFKASGLAELVVPLEGAKQKEEIRVRFQ